MGTTAAAAGRAVCGKACQLEAVLRCALYRRNARRFKEARGFISAIPLRIDASDSFSVWRGHQGSCPHLVESDTLRSLTVSSLARWPKVLILLSPLSALASACTHVYPLGSDI
jgi:hypothetical protein